MRTAEQFLEDQGCLCIPEVQRHPCQAGYPEEVRGAAHCLGVLSALTVGHRKLEPRMVLSVPTDSITLLFSMATGRQS